jgi:hypothetical protein
MHTIEIFLEYHWAVERPELNFNLNDKKITGSTEIIKKFNFQENIVHKFKITNFKEQNSLEIQLINKTDELINAQSDHWVSIKNINVDQVAADWLLFEHTVFKHQMSDQWVSNMKKQGIDIAPEYRPGTEMRLNGIFTFEFDNPFLVQRIIKDWQKNI